MWNSSSGKSSAPPRHRQQATSGSTHKTKNSTKVKQEAWEPLQGWTGDTGNDGIETIDIDAWSKKSNKPKPGLSGDSSKDGVSVYLCWTSDRCSTIPDLEEFVSASLSSNLRVTESVATPSPATSTNGKQTASKTSKAPKSSSAKCSPKKDEGLKPGSSEATKSSDDSTSRTYDGESEGSCEWVGGRAVSTAYTASECPGDAESEDFGSGACELAPGKKEEGDGESGRTATPARAVGVTRSAPVQRPQAQTGAADRKVTSAKSGRRRPAPGMRRVALRNAAATKSSVDVNQLTLDLPIPPPALRAPNLLTSPAEDKGLPSPRPKTEADKAAVLRKMEERLKESSLASRLGADLLTGQGSVSVGDLLSSSPRIVHHLGPSGDIRRHPYAGMTGVGVALGNQRLPGDAAKGPIRGPIGLVDGGAVPEHESPGVNGIRTKEIRSLLPSVSPSGGASVHTDSACTSSGDSIVARHRSPTGSVDAHCDIGSDVSSDSTKPMKKQQTVASLTQRTTLWDPYQYEECLHKTLQCAISRCDQDSAELPKKEIPQSAPPRSERIVASVAVVRRPPASSNHGAHRGPPGFRPAGKTPLQRAVETAHKKMHGQHYYLFTHSSNSQQQVDLKNLPRYSSAGQPMAGQRERASSGRSNHSERSINNAYVWKEHLENQIKQQRTTGGFHKALRCIITQLTMDNPSNAQQKKAQYHFQVGERQGRTADFVAMFDRNGHALINRPKVISVAGSSLKQGTS